MHRWLAEQDREQSVPQLITRATPERWQELEELVRAILAECGMDSRRQVRLEFPRGGAEVDVVATETIEGITYRTICECKNWDVNIPQDVVHSFRTVMHESGANRGYIISKRGFQRGAIEAARSTNIELVTFAEFQNLYFDKWIRARTWAIEKDVGGIHTYYEPFGIPGFNRLTDEREREAYHSLWEKYKFVGVILPFFSPYSRMLTKQGFKPLPIDTKPIEELGIVVPEPLKAETGYREFLQLLTDYARAGLLEMRQLNPNTRGKPPEAIERED